MVSELLLLLLLLRPPLLPLRCVRSLVVSFPQPVT